MSSLVHPQGGSSEGIVQELKVHAVQLLDQLLRAGPQVRLAQAAASVVRLLELARGQPVGVAPLLHQPGKVGVHAFEAQLPVAAPQPPIHLSTVRVPAVHVGGLRQHVAVVQIVLFPPRVGAVVLREALDPQHPLRQPPVHVLDGARALEVRIHGLAMAELRYQAGVRISDDAKGLPAPEEVHDVRRDVLAPAPRALLVDVDPLWLVQVCIERPPLVGVGLLIVGTLLHGGSTRSRNVDQCDWPHASISSRR
mmetsp:Transcript_87985/g.236073  ORF Transcript_87985/g.236073 Transcript_87985/m.236073 type:complete len:252 (+) Transcript_87985:6-761(+)